MSELDFDEILKLGKVAASPNTTASLGSIENILKEGDKIMDLTDKIFEFIRRAEESPLLSSLVRANAAKNGTTLEPLTPRGTNIQYIGIQPASEFHDQLYKELNNIPKDQLQIMLNSLKAKNEQPQDLQ